MTSNSIATGSTTGSTTAKAVRPGAAWWAFLLLFPGFFFYQTMIGLGTIGAFLGGYFSIVSIALFVPLGVAYLRALKAAGYRLPRTDLKFAFFLAYFAVVVAINGLFGANITIIKTHLASILYFFNIYIIFQQIDFAERSTMAMAVVSLLLMTATIFYFSNDGTFEPGQFGDAKSPESVATYQGFARSYVLTFVAVISSARRCAFRVALYAVGVCALFLNSSRSELVAVLVVIPLVEIYRATNRPKAVLLVLLAAAVVAINLHYASQAYPDQRVWELFNLDKSQSANSRHHLALAAKHTIAEHPWLGDYGSYIPGEYAHNILSAWVDLGLFGMACLLFLLVPTACRLLGGWFVRARSGEFLLAFALICLSLLLLVTAKTFDDMFAGAALGAYAHFRSRQQHPQPRQGAAGDEGQPGEGLVS